MARRRPSPSFGSSLDAYLVNVTVRDGAVRLWGTLDDDAARDAAERAVTGIEGVRSVENNLTPGPASGIPV